MENNTRLTVRLPINERRDLENKATQANMTESMFIREAIKGTEMSDMKNQAEIINIISRISYLSTQISDIKLKGAISKEISAICQSLK